MKPSTDRCLSHERLSSTGTADIKTATLPKGTSHIDIQAFTVDVRVTFDGVDPSAVYGLVIYAGQMPLFRPLGQGTTIKVASNSAAASSTQLAYYT